MNKLADIHAAAGQMLRDIDAALEPDYAPLVGALPGCDSFIWCDCGNPEVVTIGQRRIFDRHIGSFNTRDPLCGYEPSTQQHECVEQSTSIQPPRTTKICWAYPCCNLEESEFGLCRKHYREVTGRSIL